MPYMEEDKQYILGIMEKNLLINLRDIQVKINLGLSR